MPDGDLDFTLRGSISPGLGREAHWSLSSCNSDSPIHSSMHSENNLTTNGQGRIDLGHLTVLLAVVFYLASGPFLSSFEGRLYLLVALFPVGAIASRYGSRAGAGAGLAAYVVNLGLATLTEGSAEAFIASPAANIGSLVIIGTGWTVGHVMDRRRHAGGRKSRPALILEDAFENASIGMAILSQDGHFEQTNVRFARMFGVSTTDLIGKNWRQISPPDEHRASESRFQDVFLGISPKAEMERSYFRADGEKRSAIVHLSAIRRGDGSQGKILAQMADMTETKRVNKELREMFASNERDIAAKVTRRTNPVSGLTRSAIQLQDSNADSSR